MNRLFSLILFGVVSFSSMGMQILPRSGSATCLHGTRTFGLPPVESKEFGNQSQEVIIGNGCINIPRSLGIYQLFKEATPAQFTILIVRHARDQDVDSVHPGTETESRIQYTPEEKEAYTQLINRIRAVLISPNHSRNIETCKEIFGKNPIIEEHLHEISISVSSGETTKNEVANAREVLELFTNIYRRNINISSETVSSASGRASIGLINTINKAILEAMRQNIPAPSNYFVVSNSAIIACLIRVLHPCFSMPVILKPLDGIIVKYNPSTGELLPVTRNGKLLIFSPSKMEEEIVGETIHCPLIESADYFNNTDEDVGLIDKMGILLTKPYCALCSQISALF